MVGTPGRSGGDRFMQNIDPTSQDGGPIKPRMTKSIGLIWDELIQQIPGDSLRRVDVHELKMLCELLYIKDKVSAAVIIDPTDTTLHRLLMSTIDRIHKLSAAYGLNPSDRRRLKQIDIKEHDAVDEWMQS